MNVEPVESVLNGPKFSVVPSGVVIVRVKSLVAIVYAGQLLHCTKADKRVFAHADGVRNDVEYGERCAGYAWLCSGW